MIIKFNDTQLTVSETPYAWFDGKEVRLKLSFSETDHSFDEIAELKNNTGVIEFYDGDNKIMDFDDYTCGSKGFICNYEASEEGGKFAVEMKRKNATDVAIETLDETATYSDDAIEALAESISDIYDALGALAEQVAELMDKED